ncbi:MAG: AraC family transcriptional regulator [Bacteroidota bacterium]
MDSQLSLNIWSILFLIIAGQGMLLFAFILLKKGNTTIHKTLLGSLICSFSILMIYYALYWSDILKYLSPLVNICLSIGWAIGPITLLYMSYIDEQIIHRKQLLHFIPFAFFATVRIIDSLTYFSSYFIETGINIYSVILNLQFFHILTYTFLIFSRSKFVVQNHRWTKLISLSYAIFALGHVCYYLLVWTNYLKPEYDYIISFFMACSIYFIGYYSQSKDSIKPVANGEKYANSLLSDSLKRSLSKKLDDLIENDRLHLQHDISLDFLSEKLNASKHDTSQLINNHYQMKFFDFINFHRIEYAKSVLNQNSSQSIKINDLAISCGFNNKVTFNNAFKKSTGMTATQYRRENIGKT